MKNGHGELLRVGHHPVTPVLSVVHLAGELDLAGVGLAGLVLAEARSSGAPVVAIDLRELEFVDSSGIQLLLDASRWAEAEGRRLVLVSNGGPVPRVLRLVGIEERFELVADLAEVAAQS